MNIYIYNMYNPDRYTFGLQNGDIGFVYLRIDDDKINAYALGNGYRNELYTDMKIYTINLDASPPALIGRVDGKTPAAVDENGDAYAQLVKNETDGWNLATNYRYKQVKGFRLPDSGFAYYASCRDWHDDCDLQFIPTDAKRLISLYDSLLWKPTPVELERMIH
jgi:hypothetical protein